MILSMLKCNELIPLSDNIKNKCVSSYKVGSNGPYFHDWICNLEFWKLNFVLVISETIIFVQIGCKKLVLSNWSSILNFVNTNKLGTIRQTY